MRLSARRRRICSAVSSDCRTSIVSAPSCSRISQPDPVDRRARLRHRDDRQRQIERAADQQAADLPVAVVAGDEDDAAAAAPAALSNSRACSGRRCRTAAAASPVGAAERAQEIDRRPARSCAASPARAARAAARLSSGKSGAQVVGDRLARLRHQPPGEPGADVADRVRDARAAAARTPRQVAPKIRPLLRPCSVQRRGGDRRSAVAGPPARSRFGTVRGVRGIDSTPPESRSASCRAPAAACCAGRRRPR